MGSSGVASRLQEVEARIPTSRAKNAREVGHPGFLWIWFFGLSGLRRVVRVCVGHLTHCLRRGLHSCAASRVGVRWSGRDWEVEAKIPTSRAKNAREVGHPRFLWIWFFGLSGLRRVVRVCVGHLTHCLRRGLHSCAASRLGVRRSGRDWGVEAKIPTSRAKNAREVGHPGFLWIWFFGLSGLRRVVRVCVGHLTHCLRRGLHSCAASRLGLRWSGCDWEVEAKIPTSRAKNAREVGHPLC